VVGPRRSRTPVAARISVVMAPWAGQRPAPAGTRCASRAPGAPGHPRSVKIAEAVLRACVVAFAGCPGSDRWPLPEHAQQLLVGDLARIEHGPAPPRRGPWRRPQPHGSRIGRQPAGIAHRRRVDAGGLPELALGAPEATRPKTACSSPAGKGGSSGGLPFTWWRPGTGHALGRRPERAFLARAGWRRSLPGGAPRKSPAAVVAILQPRGIQSCLEFLPALGLSAAASDPAALAGRAWGSPAGLKPHPDCCSRRRAAHAYGEPRPRQVARQAIAAEAPSHPASDRSSPERASVSRTRPASSVR